MSTEQIREDGSFVLDMQEDEIPEQLRVVGATLDPVRDYLKQIGKTPLLSALEEVDIAKRIEAGLFASTLLETAENETKTPAEQALLSRWTGTVAVAELEWMVDDGKAAKEQMINANLRLVVSIAKRYTGRGIQFLDLIQEGNIGLNRAVEKFDYTKGYKFSTYATWWIRQAITRSMADQGKTIRIPVHMHEKLNAMHKAERQMLNDLGREPTIEELAKELDTDVETLVNYKRYARDPISLDLPLGEDGSSQFGDMIEDANALSPDDVAIKEGMYRALEAVLDTLTLREANVIRMRFGLGGCERKTLDEIGAMEGVTRERIRQIEAKTMTKLRHPSRSRWLADFIE